MSPPPEEPLHAVILAAGLSTRMGEANKLLLEFRGQPLIRHCVRQIRGAVSGHVVVVLGHEAPKVRAVLEGEDVRLVDHPQFAQGQQGSVVCGLEALASSPGPVLVALGDMPLIDPEAIHTLAAAFRAAGSDRIVVPVQPGPAGCRGNPVILPAALRTPAEGRPVRLGCRALIQNHPDRVLAVTTSHPAYFVDVDTPEAYRAVIAAGEGVSAPSHPFSGQQP